MKNLSFLVLLCSMLSFTSVSAFNDLKTDVHCATCSGSKNCYACKNCKYCKHCNSGGSCGVCASTPGTFSSSRLISKPIYKISSSTSSQCQGTTRKGARCKRMVKGGGYCYQHK